MSTAQRFAPATARNREPILDVLKRWVSPGANVLEIASGSGEHAVFLAPRLEVATWQPTDADVGARRSIDAWRAEAGVASVLPALPLDVTAPWPPLPARPDVILCVNMIHIAPWTAALALFEGALAVLAPGALLFLYGPYKREGRHTAPSNEAFDAGLRAQNPDWGVRDLDDVIQAAAVRGFTLAGPNAVVEMPANNLSVLLKRTELDAV